MCFRVWAYRNQATAVFLTSFPMLPALVQHQLVNDILKTIENKINRIIKRNKFMLRMQKHLPQPRLQNLQMP